MQIDIFTIYMEKSILRNIRNILKYQFEYPLGYPYNAYATMTDMLLLSLHA